MPSSYWELSACNLSDAKFLHRVLLLVEAEFLQPYLHPSYARSSTTPIRDQLFLASIAGVTLIVRCTRMKS